jgi:signal transduction histidine kinase
MRRAVAIDGAVAVASALAICATIAAADEPGAKAPDALAYALGALIAAPLLVRRRWPVGVLLASATMLQLYHAADYPAIGVAVPLAAAVYTAVATGHLHAAVAISIVLAVAAVVYRTLAEGETLVTAFGAGTLADVALLAAVILLADLVRSRRALAARQVEQERLRIARELHDVLAHTLAVIGIHSAAAADALPDDPEQARASLRTIREQAREATGEIKATVGLLRESRPAPDRIGDLARTASSTALAVEVAVSGAPRSLAPAVELAAYRVAQESLTNVVRHAAARTARIRLSYEPDAVVVEVSDDGRGAPDGPAGHGLAGMRERVRALGGTLEASTSDDGGFRVLARLPS